jgi:hypothetical protein
MDPPVGWLPRSLASICGELVSKRNLLGGKKVGKMEKRVQHVKMWRKSGSSCFSAQNSNNFTTHSLTQSFTYNFASFFNTLDWSFGLELWTSANTSAPLLMAGEGE